MKYIYYKVYWVTLDSCLYDLLWWCWVGWKALALRSEQNNKERKITIGAASIAPIVQ